MAHTGNSSWVHPAFGVFRFRRQIKHQVLQHEALAHGIRPEREVSPRDAPNCTGQFATRFVTPGLANDVFRRKRWQAEALPQRLPERASSRTLRSKITSICRKVRDSM